MLLTDGYSGYERFAQQTTTILHALCWSHARRQFEKAQGAEPRLVATALEQMGEFYQEETKIRALGLEGVAKLAYRGEHRTPLGEAFFAWLK